MAIFLAVDGKFQSQNLWFPLKLGFCYCCYLTFLCSSPIGARWWMGQEYNLSKHSAGIQIAKSIMPTIGTHFKPLFLSPIHLCSSFCLLKGFIHNHPLCLIISWSFFKVPPLRKPSSGGFILIISTIAPYRTKLPLNLSSLRTDIVLIHFWIHSI